ncbi:MAG: UDP-N-acetylmuramate dehydrogenase [Clostridia bacterium]|nr:UDP-N-acetylmuramate dehydrogenase [Clostridia bacterium]
MQKLIAKLSAQKNLSMRENAPMAEYTSFQIGGPADLFIEPETKEALIGSYRILAEEGITPLIIGAGSNLLVADGGIRGVVIRLAKPLNQVSVEGEYITAEAGISLARLAAEALSFSLSGLEFASGIPGSLGGAVFMNAGAYGGEMKDVIVETEYLAKDGNVSAVSGDAHDFGYRHSIFSEKGGIVLASKMKLARGNSDEIRATMLELNTRRKDKQPLNFPSAGSFFKRPEGHFAGKLIEDAGLKGTTIGGAQISEKHAGFVINTGGATAKDVCRLMDYVKEKVFEKYGIILEPEVRMLGDFSDSL